MAIIKQYHKDTDTTYVYESTSYWDEEKKQSRSKRRVIGKLDPVTGEIIPTGKRGRKNKDPQDTAVTPDKSATASFSDDKVRELSAELSVCRERIAELEKENKKLRSILSQLGKHASECMDLCALFTEEGR